MFIFVEYYIPKIITIKEFIPNNSQKNKKQKSKDKKKMNFTFKIQNKIERYIFIM